MGKYNQGTNFLYKKSNYSLNTRSRTCSSASQFVLRSEMLSLKKKHPKSHYYAENGKVKRDLSIETDVCILRGYYKRKFGRFKRSVHKTAEGTNDEGRLDHHSCGDSIPEEHNENTRLNIDITTLVVDNLRDLLNDWIKKYLLNNNETKQKIETVLDSILHKLDLQRNSSSCTYTLDIKVDDKSQSNRSKIKRTKCYAHGKQSCQTVPVTGKRIKLISTLSIPRNIKRNDININSQCLKHVSRKIRYKNVFVTNSRSSTFLLNSSSFNLINISTKSFTKRFATYDGTETKPSKKNKGLVLLSKPSYSDSIRDINHQQTIKLDIENNVYPNPLKIEQVQSLVKSIYADDPANITSTYEQCKYDHCTMTDTDCNLKNVPTPVPCHKLNWRKAKYNTETGTLKLGNKHKKTPKLKTLSHVHQTRKAKSKKIHLHRLKCANKRNIQSNYLHKKCNSSQDETNLLKDLQGLFKHFIYYTDGKNVKFDVRINVFPESESKVNADTNNDNSKKTSARDGNLTTVYNVISSQVLPEIKTSKIIMDDNHSFSSNSLQKSQPKLISILDGAISQSKYVIKKEESYESPDNINNIDKISVEPVNISTGQEIVKVMSELRVIIRDLAMTTEGFVKEHLEHLKNKPQRIKENNKRNKNDIKASTISKAVQHSNDQPQVTSGLKLKKDPKRKGEQILNTHLCKKSTSYNIIESESILKVTDMTSATSDLSKNVLLNKAKNCCLPKSKSQHEITVEQRQRKLLAYFCDELMKSKHFMQNRNTHCSCSTNTYEYVKCPHIDEFSLFVDGIKCHEDNENSYESVQQYNVFNKQDRKIYGPGYSNSSVYIDVEDRKKNAVRSRSGMSFWEGLLYCILFWIPVFMIIWLIYIYVIRDFLQSNNPAIGRTKLNTQRLKNNSLFHITLSDLGF